MAELIRRAAVAAVTLAVVSAPAVFAAETAPSPFPAPQGPALSLPAGDLAAALSCPGGFTHPAHEPVLLVHGTAATPEENWGWNYAKVLPGQGYDVCTVRLPDRALDDIQVSSEYVVDAVRRIARQSGRKIDVLGHSQGGLQPRWALRWWPDVRLLVDDLVTIGAPHHGAQEADYVPPYLCTEACFQMAPKSKFIAALNSVDETPGDVSYTSIYSLNDELVQPTTTAPMAGAENIAIQDICPGRPVEHASMAADAAAFALVMDAFTHPGPADPGRIDRGVCSQGSFPGVDPTAGFAALTEDILESRSFPYHPVAGEPPLAPYARGGQQAAAQSPAASGKASAPGPGGSPPAGPTVSGSCRPPAGDQVVGVSRCWLPARRRGRSCAVASATRCAAPAPA